jgi:hypothetical protein
MYRGLGLPCCQKPDITEDHHQSEQFSLRFLEGEMMKLH